MIGGLEGLVSGLEGLESGLEGLVSGLDGLVSGLDGLVSGSLVGYCICVTCSTYKYVHMYVCMYVHTYMGSWQCYTSIHSRICSASEAFSPLKEGCSAHVTAVSP